MPWELYRASLPRRPLPDISTAKDTRSRMVRLARSELQTHQGFYLLLTVFSPLIGATFLRYVLAKISGSDQISWFSTTLFVLATGMRPWSHLLTRLRQRTEDLHDTIHYPSPDSAFVATQKLQSAMVRVSSLERELKDIKGRVASNAGVEEIYDDLNGGLEELEKVIRKNQRRADAAKIAQEKRIASLEKSLAYLLEERRRTITHGHHISSRKSGFVYAITALPSKIWSIVTFDYQWQKSSPTLPEKSNGKRTLETIPEDGEGEETLFTSIQQSPPTPRFKFIISPFSLIGITVAAVTWPLRVVISMFLAIQRRFAHVHSN